MRLVFSTAHEDIIVQGCCVLLTVLCCLISVRSRANSGMHEKGVANEKALGKVCR